MTKGRNTVVVSIRILDSELRQLEERAKGLSVGEYLKGQIRKSLSVDTSKKIPVYNKFTHKAGDRVLMPIGKKMVEMVLPELDDEGQKIPWEV